MGDNYYNEFNNNVNFIESHVGGNLDDSSENLKDQKEIIEDSTNDYIRLINYHNKLKEEKNKNTNYIEMLDNEKRVATYRINNAPTFVGDINYSNPIIFPKEYDPYFEYLDNKNLGSINTTIIKKKTIVNIDSANRNKLTTLKIKEYYTLNQNSLLFTNNSNTFKIDLIDADKKFMVNDKIILKGFQYYSLTYKNINFFFTNDKSYVILDLKPNFDFIIPYYDVIISIQNVSNNGENQFKNIPLSLINQRHRVVIFNYNGDLRLRFELPIIFYTNNELDQTLTSDCIITFYNIGNYPISLINANYPLSEYNLIGYHTITDVTSSYLQIKLSNNLSINQNINLQGSWNNNIFYTGTSIQIGAIETINDGFLTPNYYTIPLNKSINNVASVKLLSSEIPNVKKNINSLIQISSTMANNKLYWDNLLDSVTYSIEIPTGFYNLTQLKIIIESLVSKVKRQFIYQNNYIIDTNNITVDFNNSSSIASFYSFNIYKLPQCLYSINKFSDINNTQGNNYTIKIYHPQHNLQTGDIIFITNSTNYYYISSEYINDVNGYKIFEVINNDYYSILLTDINIINDVGDTKGGYDIQIKTYNSFRLRFDFTDTFGSIIGFNYTGSSIAITPYCGLHNNYTITNLQPYVYDITKILIYNNNVNYYNSVTDFNIYNYKYLLLQCENLNVCTNPNGPSYFYKIQLNDNVNTILYNSFVDAPIFLNPPIRSLSELTFNFIDPSGNTFNFNNIDHSFTIEITSFDNSPSNTNINTSISRL